MKIKNSQIILVIATFLGVYILLAGYLSLLNKDSIKTDNIKIENKEVINSAARPLQPKVVLSSNEREVVTNEIKVSLIVLTKNYEVEIKEGSSVFDVMKELQNNTKNNFSFNYKEYPGMGVFVDEINGIKGKRGAYWIYYVNEKEASVGVSSYILKEGDSILWKQE